MRGSVFLLLLALVSLAIVAVDSLEGLQFVPFASPQEEESFEVIIQIGGKENLVKLADLNINYDHYRTNQEIGAYASKSQLETLKKRGFSYKENTEARAHIEQQLQELKSQKKKRAVPLDLSSSCANIPQSEYNFETEFQNYHDYTALLSLMKRLACRYPTHTRLFSIGRSVEGRELLVMELSKSPGVNEKEPKFKYIANMHGDEVVGRELMLRLIHRLCSGYERNEHRIANLLNTTDIFIMPTMNPDGFEHGRRSNSRFTDLNRNFPDQFRSVSLPELETSAVMDWSNTKNFVLSANFHGGSLVANYPWDGSRDGRSGVYSAAPDDATFIHLANTYARSHKKMHTSWEFPNGITNGALWYVLYGGMQDWNYNQIKDLELTIELSDDKWPAASTLQGFWEDNEEALIKYIEQVHVGIKGTVTDAQTNKPLAANIQVEGINHSVPTDPQYGDYYRIIIPGTYRVTATAGGKSLTKMIIVREGPATTLDFTL